MRKVCKCKIKPTINYRTITINGTVRYYASMNMHLPTKTILCCFPGGGDSIQSFLEYTSMNLLNERIIVFQGQSSGNGYTFQNSFVWLFYNQFQYDPGEQYQNDISFVDKVLSYYRFDNLFLTGKSDGGGFAVLFSNESKYKNKIKALAICSSAHYGLDSVNNFGLYQSNDTYNGILTNPETKIPYKIIIPTIPMLIMHGTDDQVMPFLGQNYTTFSAFQNNSGFDYYTLWKQLDPGLTGPANGSTGIVSSNTYTADIPRYIDFIKTNFNMNLYSESIVTSIVNTGYNPPSLETFECKSYNGGNILNFITLNGQNHCWAGHYNSGPDSNANANFSLDATYMVALFLNLKLGRYKPTVDTIPSNFLNIKHNPLL